MARGRRQHWSQDSLGPSHTPHTHIRLPNPPSLIWLSTPTLNYRTDAQQNRHLRYSTHMPHAWPLHRKRRNSAAFDRVIPSLATLTSYAYGIPLQACLCLYNTTLNFKHHIRTGYGISNSWYTSTPTKPLHECGQGSGASPIIWLFANNTILSATTRLFSPGAKLFNPSGPIAANRSFDAFVDDTCISVTSSPPPNCEQPTSPPSPSLYVQISSLAQTFTSLLHATGGNLNLSKCHIISTFSPTSTSTESLSIMDPSSGIPTTIPSLDPNTPYRTLGFHISANGSYSAQLNSINEKIERWITIISTTNLHNQFPHTFPPSATHNTRYTQVFPIGLVHNRRLIGSPIRSSFHLYLFVSFAS